MKDYSSQLSAVSSYGQQYTSTVKDQEKELETYSSNIKYFTWLQQDGVQYIKKLEGSLESLGRTQGTSSEEYDKANKFLEQTKLNYLGAAGAIDYNKNKIQELEDAQNKQTASWMLNIMTQQLSADGLSRTEMEYLLAYQVQTGLLSKEGEQRALDAWDTANRITDSINSIPDGKTIDLYYLIHGNDEGANRGAGGSNTTVTQRAHGGDFSGWGLIGDAPGRGSSPYEELVYAPGGAKVYTATETRRMLGHGGGGPIGDFGQGYKHPGYPDESGNPNSLGFGLEPYGYGNPNSPGFGQGDYFNSGGSGGSGGSSPAASQVAQAGATISAASLQIAVSGEKTTQATQQSTQRNSSENAAVIDELRDMNNKLDRNYEATIRAMASAVARSSQR
jgi:hypothetical protein